MAKIDHEYTHMPVCPHCGHAAKCVADLLTQDGIEQGYGSSECGRCEREYEVTLIVLHRFTTRKPEAR